MDNVSVASSRLEINHTGLKAPADKTMERKVNTSGKPQNGEIMKKTQNTIPKKRQDLLKRCGWGYKDWYMSFDYETRQMKTTSDRYPAAKCTVSPAFQDWLIKELGMDILDPKNQGKYDPPLNPETIPKPIVNQEFVKSLSEHGISHSSDGEDRHFRAHGHCLEELWPLREQEPFKRIPDLIVWPSCHDDVVRIVELASVHNVVIIPFGGGTNVTRALECNPEEKRMIVSLDTSQMSRILWVDKSNLLACCESGIIGQDLGRELEKQGLTTGHEPDSYEFSSLGGWVATRASGMKKNVYGNIEDLVAHIRFVTPSGVLEKQNQAPRVSCGPDFNQIVLGSEGSLGVVTEVIIKVRPIPECREFNSLVFPNFDLGVNFMREVARKRYQPASLRLIDNEQYQMGKLFKETPGMFGQMIETLKMMYVTQYMGIDEEKMCIAIVVYEGDKDDVAIQKARILKIAHECQGFAAGSKNGERGYTLTFTIAYIRDMCFGHGVIAESFETSVPWDRCSSLCRNVKNVVATECKAKKISHFQVSCRVTQVYDSGACVYFYFAFNTQGVHEAVEKYAEIEAIARDEIVACGGSLSHHHGVGKVRRRWYPQQVSAVGVQLYKAIKKQLDPNNVFACGNLYAENEKI